MHASMKTMLSGVETRHRCIHSIHLGAEMTHRSLKKKPQPSSQLAAAAQVASQFLCAIGAADG